MVISVKPWLEIGASRKREEPVVNAWRSPPRDGGREGTDWHQVCRAGGGRPDEADRAPLEMNGRTRSPESGRDEREAEYHCSVLLPEVIEALRPAPGRWFFDGTLGGGGHSEALLRAGASVIACDQDTEAIAHAEARLVEFGDRFVAVHANFSSLDTILAEAGIGAVDGILLDLGVSSRHLDSAERGFSFMQDGPLDMRMNPEAPITAADLVNETDEVELARILWEFGEERASRRVARAIVEARERRLLTRTLELADVVSSVLPRSGARHPATRVFQALRIAVNAELARLSEALGKSADCLKPGGVLAVIAFHSLEDRIVKRFLRRHSEKTLDRPEWPAPKPNPDWVFDLRGRKPVIPGVEEQRANPRARSAKLRVGVRR